MLIRARALTGSKLASIGTLLLLIMPGLAAPQAWANAATITIASPNTGQTIHDNAGNVTVGVVFQNDNAAQNTSLRVLLDGQPYGPLHNSRSFTLTGVERGAHTLQVQLVDTMGNVLATSGTVTFYLWRASRLFHGRK